MPSVDLLLLHAPSVYDFRERPAMYGPISDVIPSTPVFEMYPLGFVSILGYLEQHGYRVRIVNLAVKMLKNKRFDVEKFISKIDAKLIGFDLHWLAHAAGSLDLAQIAKKYHSDTPIILGGLSSTYFHREIIESFPQIDYVIRGDTTERPLLELLRHIEKEKDPEQIPNLTWRKRGGKKIVNKLSYVPSNIDDVWIDYGQVVKIVLRHMDLESTLPYESFMEYPFTAVLSCKGCSYNCITCGGSCFSFKNFFNRDGPVMKTPDRLAYEMTIISEYFKAPLFIIGDLRQGGIKYAETVLQEIKEADLDNTITYELFDMLPENYLKKIAESTDSWTLEISPESHDDKIRSIMGKPYTIEQMELTIKKALEYGTEKIDLYYMIGLSGQTTDSVLESVEYTNHLLKTMAHENKIFPFIAPMAPFLDPGSLVYENPMQYGYNILWRTLREHKMALYEPSWKLYLSYDTEWMTRNEISETTYEAMIRMNALKINHGITDTDFGEKVNIGLHRARSIMHEIDKIIASTKNEKEKVQKFVELKREIEETKKSTDLSKRELRMPGLAGIRLKGAVKHLFKSFKK
jgi:B12-binding domain/radical SAM domain protein